MSVAPQDLVLATREVKVRNVKARDIVVSREAVLRRIDDAISRLGHIAKDLRDLRADVLKLTIQS